MVGLTAIEYSCDQKLQFQLSDVNQSDLASTYCKHYSITHDLVKHLYEDKDALTLQFQKEQFHKIEISIILPFELELEQIEIQMLNTSLFNKYLKLLKITKIYDEEQSLLELKGGLQDNNK